MRHHPRLPWFFVGVLLLTLAGCATYTPTPVPPPTSTLAPTISASDLNSWVNTYFTSLVENHVFTGSVLIARSGQILVDAGYGLADRDRNIPNTPQTKFRIASLTKQFTAMAILMLQARGKLDVRDSICKYLSDCPAAWLMITIHHLLTHTSGIPNETEDPAYPVFKKTPAAPAQTIARIQDKPLDFQPGEKWSYSNSGYILLGEIVERVSGQSYEAFLQQNIFGPLGMTSSGYDHNRSDLAVGYLDRFSVADYIDMSIPFSAGALYSTVEDLYRWEQALYTDRLLPRDLRDRMFTGYAAIPGQSPVPDSTDWAYGYGWMLAKEGGRELLMHTGSTDGYASIIARYPDDKVTIILLSNIQRTDIYFIQSAIFNRLFGFK